MIEPSLPWRLSGSLLVIFGIIDCILWINSTGTSLENVADPVFAVGITVSLTLLIGGIFILMRKRIASWIIIVVLILNIVIVTLIVPDEGHAILGENSESAFLGSLCIGVICGSTALIPIILGLKRGMAGKY